MELASVLTATTILADASVTLTVSEMTYNVSSGTLNHTQPTNQCAVVYIVYHRMNSDLKLFACAPELELGRRL